jgi:predicted DNA-binding transcriptional regulator AlpA
MQSNHFRPRQAAVYLGMGESTLWAKSKTDPDFPQLIRLSPRITLVTKESMDRYIELKAKQSAENIDKAASA